MVIDSVTVKELVPYLRNGWIAMDKNGDWCWYKHKPVCVDVVNCHKWLRENIDHLWCNLSQVFNIAPCSDDIDWKESLREVKND